MTPITLLTRCFAPLLLLVLLGCAWAEAQSLPVPFDAREVDTRPELPIPVEEFDGRSLLTGPETIAPGEIIQGEHAPLSEMEYCDQDYNLWSSTPAVVESTGTWLRRGFWYARADAVVMNKYWNKSDLLLATQDPNAAVNLFFNPALSPTNRIMFLKGRHPGADAGVRLTLGRFLFRDSKNRDHTAEFTAYSGGDFVLDCALEADTESGLSLFVPLRIDGGNQSFDTADRMQVSYTSRFNNFEVNYRVKRRMRKDQMVLEPNGHWHRRAQPTLTREFLIGLRYFDLTERLEWNAENFAVGMETADGSYLIRTDNNMFGFQMGAGHAYETARWSVSALGKAGVYVNDAKGRARYLVTDNEDLNFYNRMTEEQLSFIGDFRITGRWHLRPNLSLRASYELMYVSSVALAPHQATFIPGFTKLATSGDPFYHGASFGLECYW